MDILTTLTTQTLLQNLTLPLTSDPLTNGKVLIEPQSLIFQDFVTLYCAHGIINAHGDQESLLLYHYFDDVVQNLQMESRMVVNLGASKLFHNRPMNFIVFIVDNILIIKTYLEMHYYTKYFNAYAKFLIIYRGLPERVIEIFELFYSLRLSRVVVMTTEHNVFGYVHSCFNHFVNPRFLYNCAASNLSSISEAYDNQQGVSGCTIRVLALAAPPYVKLVRNVYSGIAVSILRQAAKLYKFTLEYVEHQEDMIGYQLRDSNVRRQAKLPVYEGLLGLLEAKAGDVALGLISVNSSQTEDFAATGAYLDSYYGFYMSHNVSVRQRDKTAAVFAKHTWYIYFTSIALFILTTYLLLLLYAPPCSEKYQQWSYMSLQFWGMSFARPVTPPKATSTRIIFITWALFTCTFTATYESTLASYLMQPPEVKLAQCLRDIVAMNLTPIGTAMTKDTYFRQRDDPIYDIVYDRWEDCVNITRCVIKYWRVTKFALFTDSRNMNAALRGLDNFLHSITAFHHFLWIVVHKGTGLERLLNRVILQVQATGLLNKWIKENSYKYSYEVFSTKSFGPLRLVHYRTISKMYIGGTIMSIAAFVCELGYYHQWWGKLKRRIHSNSV